VVGDIETGTDVLIIGAGPSGYTAAIRLGQMGLDVTLVGTEIGGVCLHHGCIPIKTFSRSLDMALDAISLGRRGVDVSKITVDLGRIHEWKDQVVGKLEGGIRSLMSGNGVQVFEGTCSFTSSSTATVSSRTGNLHLNFSRAVIATGSKYSIPAGIRVDGRRVVTPYGLTRLKKAPVNAVVLGGGVAGMTSAPLLAKMGSDVTIAHKGPVLVRSVDEDVMRPVMKWMGENKIKVYPNSTWTVSPDGATVTINSNGNVQTLNPDLVLVASPLVPNLDGLDLKVTKVRLSPKGFIEVDSNYRTSDPAIYAIGDVLGTGRNASTAFRDGSSLANVLAGRPALPDYQARPVTIDAEPPIAWAGMSEKAAEKAGIAVTVSRSSYSANGGAITQGFEDGIVKVIAEKSTGRILGAQIVGKNSAELISEAMLAIEMGASLEDVALTLHPHPEITEVFFDACARGAGLSSNTVTKNWS